MPSSYRAELVIMPSVFTPARTALFWEAVFATVKNGAMLTELAMTVHLAQMAEALNVRRSETTQFGFFVGGLIERGLMHGTRAGSVRNSWEDMRRMPVGYLRTFMEHLGAPFDENGFSTLMVLEPARIPAEYSGACNRSWREGRSALMMLAGGGATPEIVKSYWNEEKVLRMADSHMMHVFGAAQVPGHYAARLLDETLLRPAQIADAWEAGLPVEYARELVAA